MKGILKGTLFSLILMTIFILVSAFITMKFNVPRSVFKGILWVVLSLCVFIGCLPVAKSGESGKILRGLACAVITVFVLFLFVSISGKQIPNTGNFYAFSLICLLCGFLGSLVGSR